MVSFTLSNRVAGAFSSFFFSRVMVIKQIVLTCNNPAVSSVSIAFSSGRSGGGTTSTSRIFLESASFGSMVTDYVYFNRTIAAGFDLVLLEKSLQSPVQSIFYRNVQALAVSDWLTITVEFQPWDWD